MRFPPRRCARSLRALGLTLLLPVVGVAGERTTLAVFAGAGFRLPIEAAVEAYEARSSVDVEVEVTFAGSGCLLAQAELAGRGDVFIPGERHYLDQARERDVAGDAVSIAYLQPVIAVPRGNPASISGLADLGRPELRVGLGDPRSVAVGVATERWMTATLDDATRAAIGANVQTRAINVNELGSQLTLGALDAAVVWDVTVPLFDALEMVAPSSATPHRTVISGGVLTFSRHPRESARFLAFLAGPDGAAIFAAHGYEPAGAMGTDDAGAGAASVGAASLGAPGAATP